MNATPVDLKFATRLINQGCTIMVTTFDKENNRPCGMTCQWSMPVSKTEVAITLGAASNTCKCILENKKYVINIPVKRILDQVTYFGSCHGGEEDKFPKSTLHLRDCVTEGFGKIAISEAISFIELELEQDIKREDGAHIIIGQIVSASVDE